jgi:predicted Ser/Thr protein kinase
MPDSSDLLAAGIEPAGSPAPSGWIPPTPEVLNGVFPQLEIIALIGQGGMGAVYKARQTHLERLVAVKLLSAERGVDPAFVERFTREARALARLQHPQIVTLYDFGRAGSWLYLVMEYVEGANLRQLMATGRLDPTAAMRLVAPLCDALVHAHAQGVVHRDLKPENILIDSQGQPKIADFGLAKLRSANGTLTQTGDALGTLHYMSPEQISGVGDIDHRADVYALGVIFYEMLTGNLPLGRCLPPSQSGSDPRLDEVVLRSLEREPDKRWQTVEELRQAVAQIQAKMPVDLLSNVVVTRSWQSKWVWGLLPVTAFGLFVLFLMRPEQPIATPMPQVSLVQEKSPVVDARLAEALNEAKRLETILAAMEMRKSEMERKFKELTQQTTMAEAATITATEALQSARQQQASLAKDVERLTKQRQDLTQEFEAAMKTMQTKADETALIQGKADILAKELAQRMPGPAPAAPTRLELSYDRDAMSTIGRVVRADGSSVDLAPVPWPRDGAKILVSATKDTLERQFTELVVAYNKQFALRQRLIGELVAQMDELVHLDVAKRHVDLIAQLKRLGEELP